MIEFVLRGGLLGFSLAAPVGPIGLLCIQRTLAQGRRTGFATGLGAATADALYGLVAGLGLGGALRLLTDQAIFFRIAGGIFLAYLGVRIMLGVPARQEAGGKAASLFHAYRETVVLTLCNPMTILTFAALFAGAFPGGSPSPAGIGLFVGGVFLGSALWWLVLSLAAGAFRARLMQHLRAIDLVAGLVILAMAGTTLVGAFDH